MYSQGRLRQYEEFKGYKRTPFLIEWQSTEKLCDYTLGPDSSYTTCYFIQQAFIDVNLGLSIRPSVGGWDFRGPMTSPNIK